MVPTSPPANRQMAHVVTGVEMSQRVNDNMMKLTILCAVLVGIGGAVGLVVGGIRGMLLAALAILGVAGGISWWADSLILRMSRAHRLAPDEIPWLIRMVADLARRADLPAPTLYVIDSPTPNAFAIGRHPSCGAVVLTTGITHLLTRDELAAVMAHELTHIKHRDTLLSDIVATLAGASILVVTTRHETQPRTWYRRLLLLLVAPVAGALIRFGISPTREYLADAGGAAILGNPLVLASALEKVEWAIQQMPMISNPGMAPLYFVNPLSIEWSMLRLFRSHPPTEKRVAYLRALTHSEPLSRTSPGLEQETEQAAYPEF